MAKRFQDNEEWKSHFVRGLKGPYRAFWFWLKSACDHGGIWEIDIDEARMRTGFFEIEKDEAEQFFDKKILRLPCGEKWFLLDFCFEQYNTSVLDPYKNTAHRGVVKILHRFKLIDNDFNILREPNIGALKPLPSIFKGTKDMDKDLNNDKAIIIKEPREEILQEADEIQADVNARIKPKDKPAKTEAKTFVTPLTEAFAAFREMRVKIKKPLTERAAGMIHTELSKLAGDDVDLKIAILDQSTRNCWQDVYGLKDKGPRQSETGTKSKAESILTIATAAEYREA